MVVSGNIYSFNQPQIAGAAATADGVNDTTIGSINNKDIVVRMSLWSLIIYLL